MKLPALTRHYVNHYREDSHRELDWFKNQSSLGEAIEVAALAEDERGKRYSHQRRIKRAALEKAKDTLLTSIGDLRRCKNFEEVLDLVEAELDEVYGLGELYFYDTALRIGANLGLLPEKVYLHAGTRAGANAWGLDAKARAVEVDALPKELQQLLPHEIEDVLCIYKERLK